MCIRDRGVGALHGDGQHAVLNALDGGGVNALGDGEGGDYGLGGLLGVNLRGFAFGGGGLAAGGEGEYHAQCKGK